jgi:predicted PurR-regulated permease PerM
MRAITKHRASRLTLATAILVFFGLVFIPFITPLLLAVLFAFALEPTVSYFSNRASRRKIPAIFILTGIFLSLTLPLTGLTISIVHKVKALSRINIAELPLYGKITLLWEKAAPYFTELTDNGGGGDMVNKGASKVMAITSATVAGVPGFVLGLLVFSAALYVFLTQSKKIKNAFTELHFLSEAELDRIIDVVQKSSYTALVASAISGFVQSLLVLIGSAITGFHEYFLVFLLTFIASFIPMLGAGSVGVTLTLICFLDGRYGMALVMGIFSFVAAIIDNFIKPYINSRSGDDAELNPVMSLLAIIGAVLVYGLPGLILGPVLTRLAFQIIPILIKADAADTGE